VNSAVEDREVEERKGSLERGAKRHRVSKSVRGKDGRHRHHKLDICERRSAETGLRFPDLPRPRVDAFDGVSVVS
jgi:hypothetical protein